MIVAAADIAPKNDVSDAHGHHFSYLRLSVTDACNFRCTYCLPAGEKKIVRQPLSVNEIGWLVRAFSEAGLRKVRITGGEPTLRADIVDIVRRVASEPEVHTVAISSNGFRMASLARDLAAAGLQQANISVDSLDAARFAAITGQDRLFDVRRGIDALMNAGVQVKINAVWMRGEDELPRFLDLIRDSDVTVRFIELMRTIDNARFFETAHASMTPLKEKLSALGFTVKRRRNDAGPAVELGHPDYRGSIGYIEPYGSGFCDSCNRLRITSLGHLQLCLFGDDTFDLRPLLQGDSEAVIAAVRQALVAKPAAHRLHQLNPGRTRHLAMVGG
jgi:GTP 3',8-cyclase